MQRDTQRSDDESKLTNLRQTKATLHGRLQRLTTQQYAQGTEERLSQHHGHRDDKDREGILHNHLHIHHHAHRYKEDGTKEVLYRTHQAFDMLRLDRLGQNGAHDEGTKGG